MHPAFDMRVFDARRFYFGCFLLAASIGGLSTFGVLVSRGAPWAAERPFETANLHDIGAADADDEPPKRGSALAGVAAERSTAPGTRARPAVASAPVLIARVDPSALPAPPTAIDLPIAPEAEDDADMASTPWVAPVVRTYRTLCVRLCDGAYVPMSFSVPGDRLDAEAARCEQGCAVPARLFVMAPDGEASRMVDLAGRAYDSLPNANRFRVSYDAACTCRGASSPVVAASSQSVPSAGALPLAQSVPRPEAPPTTGAAIAAPTTLAPADARGVAAADVQPVRLGSDDASAGDPGSGPSRSGPLDLAGRAVADLHPAVLGPADWPTLRGRLPTDRKAKRARKGSATQVAIRAGGGRAETRQRSFQSDTYWRLSYWDTTN